ncbi:MAG: hypothetical protein AAF511_10520, partial [Pseudomonadota bacterium]
RPVTRTGLYWPTTITFRYPGGPSEHESLFDRKPEDVRVSASLTDDRGTHTVAVELQTQTSIDGLLWGKAVLKHSVFKGAKILGFDHLFLGEFAAGFDDVRHRLVTAARALQFADITGLQPTNTLFDRRRSGEIVTELPGGAHSTVWRHPQTKMTLLMDQPLVSSLRATRAERHQWAKRYGFVIQRVRWGGVRSVNATTVCDLIVAKKHERQLDVLLDALRKAPPRFCPRSNEIHQFPDLFHFPTPGELIRG